MEVKAKLRYAKVGTLKARLVVDSVRGLGVNEALKTLAFMNKKTAYMVRKLIESAVAGAEKQEVIDIDNLYVKSISVDQGPSLKRLQPRAQGRAFVVKKKVSHINLTLDER